MHVPIPKPLHGWREFFGEVGIIVLGVSIALGADQLVENLAWRMRVHDARVSLRSELGMHYQRALEWRTVEPCVDAELSVLEQRMLTSGKINRPAPFVSEQGRYYVVRVPSRPYVTSAWQAAITEGVSSHLNGKERFELGAHYRLADQMAQLNDQIVLALTRVNALGRPIELDPTVKLSLLQSMDEARDTNRWMGLIASQLVKHVTALGFVPSPASRRAFLDRSATVAFCRNEHLPMRSPDDAASTPVTAP